MKKEYGGNQSNILRILCTIGAILILLFGCFKQIKEMDVVSKSKEMYQSFDTALENDTGSNIEDFKTMIKEGNFEEIEKSLHPILE